MTVKFGYNSLRVNLFIHSFIHLFVILSVLRSCFYNKCCWSRLWCSGPCASWDTLVPSGGVGFESQLFLQFHLPAGSPPGRQLVVAQVQGPRCPHKATCVEDHTWLCPGSLALQDEPVDRRLCLLISAFQIK